MNRLVGALSLLFLLLLAVTISFVKRVLVLPRNLLRPLFSKAWRTNKRGLVTGVDATWLVESPSNPMVITLCFVLQTDPDQAALRKVIRERLVGTFRGFRLKLATADRLFASPDWCEVENFDSDEHVSFERLPSATDEALAVRIGEIMSSDLPHDKPRWRIDVLGNAPEDRAMVVARIHHSIGDGAGLAAMIWSITDEDPGATKPARPILIGNRRAEDLQRAKAGNGARAMMRTLARIIPTLGKLLTIAQDSRTGLKGKPDGRKRVAWSRKWPLEELKATAKQLNVTMNDLLVGAMATGISDYLAASPTKRAQDLRIRVVVPVDIRKPNRPPNPDHLGNYFGVVFLELPLGPMSGEARIAAVSNEMRRLKTSPEPWINYLVGLTIGNVPGIGSWISRHLASRSTAVFTNAAAPRLHRFLAGTAIDNILFWVPQAGGITTGFSIVSYAGLVTLGITTDAAVLATPQAIIPFFEDELDRLQNKSNPVAAQTAAERPSARA